MMSNKIIYQIQNLKLFKITVFIWHDEVVNCVNKSVVNRLKQRQMINGLHKKAIMASLG